MPVGFKRAAYPHITGDGDKIQVRVGRGSGKVQRPTVAMRRIDTIGAVRPGSNRAPTAGSADSAKAAVPGAVHHQGGIGQAAVLG